MNVEYVPSYTHRLSRAAPCRCPAYKWPHRAGGGRCMVDLGPVCNQCGALCEAIQVEEGVGWTEFWGRREYDSHICTVSSCCHAEVIQ